MSRCIHERGHQLSALLLGLHEPATGAFDEDGQSSLSETANVLAGAYAGALGTMLGGMVMISVPAFGVTPPEDVLSRFASAGGLSPFGLCIETSFAVGETDAGCVGHMVLLPGTGTLEFIVDSLAHAM